MIVALLDITDHIALLLDTSIEFVWVGWLAKSFSSQTQRSMIILWSLSWGCDFKNHFNNAYILCIYINRGGGSY